MHGRPLIASTTNRTGRREPSADLVRYTAVSTPTGTTTSGREPDLLERADRARA